MIQTDKILEFDKIKEKWSELAFTAWQKKESKIRYRICLKMSCEPD